MTFKYIKGKRRSGRWIDTETNEVINANEVRKRYQSYDNVSSQRIRMLRFMIDGRQYLSSTYGGNGICYLNCEGGFAWNAEVNRMIRRGEITIGRTSGFESSFSSANIRRTYAKVTDKGRDAYAKWKKKNSKK